MPGRRFVVWPETRLLPVLVAVLVLLGVVTPPNTARAAEPLLGTASEDVPLRRDPKPTKITRDTPAEPAVTSVASVVDPDEDPAVKLARLRQETERLKQTEIAAFERVRALSGGSSTELEAAKQQYRVAREAVLAARARGNVAALENEAVTQAAVQSALKLRYGPDGPTTSERFQSGLAAAAGIMTGIAAGTVNGVANVADALMHPVVTLTNVYGAISAPPSTPEEQLKTNVAILEGTRRHAVSAAIDPFGANFEDAQLIGELFVAPAATAHLLGAFGNVARAGHSVAAETGAGQALTKSDPLRATEPVTAATVGARQAIARDYYLSASGFDQARFLSHARAIDFSESVEVVKLPKGTPLYQWVNPGGGPGQYFSYAPLRPEQLGIYAGARQLKRFVVTEDVAVLRSTAAPILDTWTVPGKSYPVPGRGTQLFTNKPQVIELVE